MPRANTPPTQSPCPSQWNVFCLCALCRRISFPLVTMNYRCMQNLVNLFFFYVIAFKHLFLKLISNSILNTHSSLQKKAKTILHVQYIFSTFFYIRKEKSLLAEIFHIIYFLVSILILVLKEMLSCRITCNLGIYLQKLYGKTCTFPLSSRVLPKPAPLTLPKLQQIHWLQVYHAAPAVKEVRRRGKHAHVLSLKLHREDLLTPVSVPTDETHGILSW